MKKCFIYSVFDKEIGVYDTCYCYPNDVYCRRYFEDQCEKTPSLNKRIDKFAVHKIGEVDFESGKITPINPVVLFELSSLVVSK